MPGIKDAISAFSAKHVLDAPSPPFILDKAAREVRLLCANYAPREPTRFDLAETYAALYDVRDDLDGLTAIPVRHLKRAPWVIFEAPKEGETPLAEIDGFLSRYLNVVEKRRSSSAILSLAAVFLRFYPVGKSYFSTLRDSISALLSMADGARVRAFRERSEEYGFFRADGPERFGAQLAQSKDAEELVTTAGLVGGLAERGFSEVAAGEMLKKVQMALQAGSLDLGRLEDVLLFIGETPDNKCRLRYPGLRVQIADTLLLPFDSLPAAQDEQNLIHEFLIRHYDDPRIRDANWHGVDDSAKAVFLRWLVHSTLEDFFRVVREGSKYDADADRMWPYREAFWSAYLRKGVISDAWVILGYQIAHASRQFLSDHANAYGTFQKGSGVKSVHAALVMRIGDLTITEWNHSGKYRVWHSDKQSAPAFYKVRYTKGQLMRDPDFEASHHGSENGSWQGKLASLIAEWTGVRVTYREYMPQ